MKLVVDIRSLGSKPSGIGIYAYDFIRQMLADKRFEIYLLTDVAVSEQVKDLEKMGAHLEVMGKLVDRSLGVFSYFRFVQAQLDKIRPDAYWEVNFMAPVRLRNTGKYVITVHDMFPVTNAKYLGLKYSMYFKYCMNKTLKQTDLIIYNSKETKEETQRVFPITKKIKDFISYIIVDMDTAAYTPGDEDYFLYVGNMEKRKGVDLLIKGYAEYRKKGGTRKLVLAGKMLENDIEQLLTDTQKEVEGLEYIGYVDAKQKNELYKNCYAFVFPSRAEGFGIPVIEAINFYKPVVVGNLSVFEELIGDCANYFDMNCSQEKQIMNLSDALLEIGPVNMEECTKVIKKYRPETLGKALIEEFANL